MHVQNELEAAKLEIQNWHSTLKNEPSLPAGITSGLFMY